MPLLKEFFVWYSYKRDHQLHLNIRIQSEGDWRKWRLMIFVDGERVPSFIRCPLTLPNPTSPNPTLQIPTLRNPTLQILILPNCRISWWGGATRAWSPAVLQLWQFYFTSCNRMGTRPKYIIIISMFYLLFNLFILFYWFIYLSIYFVYYYIVVWPTYIVLLSIGGKILGKSDPAIAKHSRNTDRMEGKLGACFW